MSSSHTLIYNGHMGAPRIDLFLLLLVQKDGHYKEVLQLSTRVILTGASFPKESIFNDHTGGEMRSSIIKPNGSVLG